MLEVTMTRSWVRRSIDVRMSEILFFHVIPNWVNITTFYELWLKKVCGQLSIIHVTISKYPKLKLLKVSIWIYLWAMNNKNTACNYFAKFWTVTSFKKNMAIGFIKCKQMYSVSKNSTRNELIIQVNINIL